MTSTVTRTAGTSALRMRGLSVRFGDGDKGIQAVDGIDLDLAPGTVLGLVGESGSGKSTVGKAVGVMLPRGAGVDGQVEVGGTSLLDASTAEVTRVRRDDIAFVFQDPMGTLDPTARIARQLEWVHPGRPTREELAALLRRVHLTDTERILRAYPHELSGGMAQRVTIAMAMAGRPRVIVADEPTAALDPSIRQGILDLLLEIRDELDCAIVLLTHDVSSVAGVCDEVAVMYAGRIIERGPAGAVIARPTHPYTIALLQSRPGIEKPGERIQAIPGTTPVLRAAAADCAFRFRCQWAVEVCATTRPEPIGLTGIRTVVCHRAEEISAATTGEERV